MEIFITLLMINLMCVIIIAYLDAPNEIASQIMSCITQGKIKRVILRKPFSCPLCMCWIISLLFLVFTLPFTFEGVLTAIVFALLNAISTKYILYIIELLDKVIVKLFTKIDELL